ncbi:hypothetical protein niasHS_008354 [Heterodera schachtii]|uniref:UDP-glucuronosyltransferase n=1 Tax=Heterodera schachtii TaxID=97005 RepID=A0ABD2JCQ2_HETSC
MMDMKLDENDKLPDRNDEKLLNVRYFIEKSDNNKISTESSRKNGTPPNDLTYLASLGPPPMRSNNLDENKRIEQKKIVGIKIGDHREEQLQKRSAEIWTNHMEESLEKIKEHMEKDPIYQQLAEQKYAFDNFPGLDDIFRKTRFFLVNSQSEVDFDNYRSVKGMEKVKFIGGFNLMPKARELDEKISKKSDGKKGIILVSFGTVVDTTNPTFSDVIEAVKETIKNFPEFLFVWKMSKGDKYIRNISNELSNVHSADWVEQQGILGNSKTVAFVSHCGMNSVLEGIYNGVPMICVPFFGDQFYNAESLARQQIGLVVDRQQDKGTVQQQLTVALAIALKLNESNVSEDKIEMDKLTTISAAFHQKNIPKIISDAFRVIEDEMCTNDRKRTVIGDLLMRNEASYEPVGWPELII